MNTTQFGVDSPTHHPGPTKFTPEHIEPLLDAISRGATYKLACAVARISDVTFDNWRSGKYLGEQETLAFLAALKSAEAKAAMEALDRLREAGKSAQNWTANAWLLERRWPEEFGRRDYHDITSGGEPLVKAYGLTQEQLDQV